MPKVEFVGQSSQDSDNLSANTSRLLNLYREPVQAGGRTRFILKSVLGQQAFVDHGAVFMRALEWVNNNVYSITGGKLYEISSLGGSSPLASVVDDVQATISGNTGAVTACSGGNYYVWDGAITQPTGQAFSEFSSVDYVGGYTMLTEKNGRRVQWSNLADPKTFNALNFATAEGGDDDIIRGVAVNGYYLVMKKRTIEIWYATGQSNALAFARVAGDIFETGLKSFGLVSKIDDGLFFVGDDNIVYITSGERPTPISTTAVTTSMEFESPQRCFYYEDGGHKFCVVQFYDRPAWCYDIATGEWHERSEGSTHGPWSAVSAVRNADGWLCGTDEGQIYKMERNNADLTGALYRRAVSRTLTNDSKRFKVSKMEIFARVGTSQLGAAFNYVLGTGDGWAIDMGGALIDLGSVDANPRAASMWVRTSRDGGHTFSNEKVRSLGSLGDYETRAVWRGLGQFRQLTVEVNMTDAAEIPIYADGIIE